MIAEPPFPDSVYTLNVGTSLHYDIRMVRKLAEI